MAILIVDSHYLLHRCLHVEELRSMVSSQGTFTGGVFGFIKSLRNALYALKDFVPPITRVYSVWDSPDHTLSPRRLELFPGYKAHRRKKPEELTDEDRTERRLFDSQITYLRLALTLLGCVVVAPGCEGDDAIAWLVRDLVSKYPPSDVVVMSDDKDMLQLVSHYGISVYRPMSEAFVTPANFVERIKTPPDLYLVSRAIVGDDSDGIPGVKGVGDKTIQDVLAHAGTIGQIKDYCWQAGKSRQKKIVENWATVERNLELMDLRKLTLSDAQVADLQSAVAVVTKCDPTRMLALCTRLEFRTILGTAETDYTAWLGPFSSLC